MRSYLTSFLLLLACAASALAQRDAKFAVVRGVAKTAGTGTIDYTVSGLGTPKGTFTWSAAGNGTTNDTAGVHGYWSVGAAVSAANTANAASRVASAVTTGHRGHRASINRLILRMGNNNSVAVAAEPHATDFFITDGVKLNWPAAGSQAWFVNHLFIAGADAGMGHVTVDETRPAEATTDFTVPSGTTCGIIYSANDDFGDLSTHAAYGVKTVGLFAVMPDGTIDVVGLSSAWLHPDSGTSANYCYVSASGLPTVDPTESTSDRDGFFTLSKVNDTTLRLHTVSPTGDDNEGTFAVVCYVTGALRARVGVATLPAATGSQTIALAAPFKPQAIIAALTGMTATDTFSGDSANAGVAGLAAVTRPLGVSAGNAEFSATVTIQRNVTTSNTQSLSSNDFIRLPLEDGSVDAVANFASFAYRAVNVTISDAPAAARVVPYLAIEARDSPTFGRARIANAGGTGIDSRATLANNGI